MMEVTDRGISARAVMGVRSDEESAGARCPLAETSRLDFPAEGKPDSLGDCLTPDAPRVKVRDRN